MRRCPARPGRLRAARRRLGPPPARPRRPDLRRPARPHRPAAARLPPGDLRRGLRAGAEAAARGRGLGRRHGRPPLRGDGQPGDGDRRGGARRGRGGPALRCGDAALPGRGLLRRGGRGHPPAPPLHRPPPRADAPGARAPAQGDGGDARVPRRGGLPRHRDPGADPLDAGGRTRLPRPQPPPAGLLLCPAAVPAALQAAAHGRRLRALLPDRPLLPGRGPARRSAARLHPARHRDVLRRRRRRDRGQRTAPGPSLRARRRPRAGASDAPPALRRGDIPLWDRPPGHPLRARARRPRRHPPGHRVQGLPLGDRVRWHRPRPQRRRPRDAALGPRRAHLPRPGARRQGAGLGLPRGRRLALADRQVPQRRGARRPQRARSAPRRATCCSSSPTGPRSPTRCSASSASTWPPSSTW